jgi:hypothetical protein
MISTTPESSQYGWRPTKLFSIANRPPASPATVPATTKVTSWTSRVL